MLIGIVQSVLTLLTVGIFYTIDSLLIRYYDRQRQASGSGRAWDFTLFIFAMVVVLVLQPILLPTISFRMNQPWGQTIQAIGVLIVLISFALHIWSRVHLRHFY